MMLDRRSVRFRITATATVAVLVVLGVTGIGLVLAQRRVLTDNLTESLALSASTLAKGIEDGSLSDVLTGFGDGDAVAQIVDRSGRVIAATANLEGERPIAGPAPSTGSLITTVERLPHDEARFRVLTRRAGTSTIHVGSGLDDIEESTRTLSRSLAVAVPAAAILLAALVWWLVGRTLRPVEAIRSEVAGIGGADLARRVPEPGTGDEVDQLARTMNAMLGRLESSSDRQRRFVGDASHELRSPLTRMRTELEVDTAATREVTHRSVLDEVVGMQRLVDDLLALARDANAVPRRERIDLDDIVLREAGRLCAVWPGAVSVDVSAVSGAQVDGDPDQLARIVTNLLDNGGRHAASAVTVTLVEEAAGGSAVLTVADDGPGIPAADRERVFERFTRLDDARSAADGGSGLGLAITRELVETHGGTVTVDATAGGGARFVVRLPLGESYDSSP